MTTEELEYIVHANDREVLQLKAALDGVNSSLTRGMTKAGGISRAQLGSIGRTAGRMGLITVGAVTAVGAASLHMAGDFEKTLNIAQVNMNATGDEMEDVRKKALALGQDLTLPGVSAKDAAEAMNELAKGGLNVTQVMAAAKGTLALATVAEMDNAEAGQIVARALNAFALKGKDATKVADLLAQGASASTASVQDFADGFRNAGAQAGAMGVPIEDLTTAIAIMTNKGIDGATAGVSLKVMLTRLAPVTKKARDAMRELGLITGKNNNAFFDAKGKFVGFSKAAQLMKGHLKGLTDEQKVMKLQTIFGTDAQRAANFVLAGGSKAYEKMKKKVQDAATAQEQSAAANKGFNGAMDNFKSSMETAAIVLGTILLPYATTFLKDYLIPAANFLGEHTTLALILAAAIKIYLLVTNEATKAMWKFTASLLTNPVFLIIGAIVLLGIALVVAYKKSETFRRIVDAAFAAVKTAAMAVWNFLKGPLTTAFNGIKQAAGAAIDFISSHWGTIKTVVLLLLGPLGLIILKWEAVKKVGVRVAGVIATAWDGVSTALSTVWGWINSIIEEFKSAVSWIGDLADKIRSLPSMPDIGVPGFLGGNARGTSYHHGGMTLVGERGPELVNLPSRSKVTPAGATRRALSETGHSGQGPLGPLIHVEHMTVRSDADLERLAQRYAAKTLTSGLRRPR